MVRGVVRAPRRGPVPDRARGVGNGMDGAGQLRSWPFAHGPEHGSSESAARRGPAAGPAAQARECRPFARGCGGGAGPVRPVGHPGRRRGALARSGEAVFRLYLHGPHVPPDGRQPFRSGSRPLPCSPAPEQFLGGRRRRVARHRDRADRLGGRGWIRQPEPLPVRGHHHAHGAAHGAGHGAVRCRRRGRGGPIGVADPGVRGPVSPRPPPAYLDTVYPCHASGGNGVAAGHRVFHVRQSRSRTRAADAGLHRHGPGHRGQGVGACGPGRGGGATGPGGERRAVPGGDRIRE